MKIGITYRLRTPKTGLGRVVGEVSSVSVNLKANSFKRKSEKALSESVNLKALIGRQSYYQVIRGRFREIQRGLSKCKEDRTFALKLDNHFCPMTCCYKAN